MRPNGRDRHPILKATEGFGAHKPSYSPDGTRILFMCEKQGTLPKPPDDRNEVRRRSGSRSRLGGCMYQEALEGQAG